MTDVSFQKLRSIPIFGSFSLSELTLLKEKGKVLKVKKGQIFELRSLKTANIILNGSFKLKSIGGSSQVFFSSGSFFGVIPFVENSNRGKVEALSDSSIFVVESDDLVKLFLSSFKLFRSYLKIIDKLGFKITDLGEIYKKSNSSILTFFSKERKTGKTVLASLMAKYLSKNSKVIILELSYNGESIFNNFNVKLNMPLSHKEENSDIFATTVENLIKNGEKNIDMLNLTFGSKVKFNSEIISPLIFILSKTYKYIILDLQNNDFELVEKVFLNSDYIFTMLKKKDDRKKYFEDYDRKLADGQRVNYVINEFYSGEVNSFSGGYILNKFDIVGFDFFQQIDEEMLIPIEMLNSIIKKKKALFLEPTMLNSFFYAGFFSSFFEEKDKFDLIYCSGYSSIIALFYIISSSRDDYISKIKKIFDENEIQKLINVEFPTSFVFPNRRIKKVIANMLNKDRVEFFKNNIYFSLTDESENNTRLFSTGDLEKILTASFSLYPVYEEVDLFGKKFSSGYPNQNMRVEDLFRTNVSEIVHLSVENSLSLEYRGERLLDFFRKYQNFLSNYENGEINSFSDKKIVLNVSEKYVKIEKIIESVEDKGLKY